MISKTIGYIPLNPIKPPFSYGFPRGTCLFSDTPIPVSWIKDFNGNIPFLLAALGPALERFPQSYRSPEIHHWLNSISESHVKYSTRQYT